MICESRDVDIIIATGSGDLLKGRLLGTLSFLILPGSNLIQEIWIVRYNTEIINSDYGI